MNEREATAVHEASHAVVAAVLKADVGVTGIHQRGGGSTLYVRPDNPAERAVVALAGTLAEANYRGRSDALAGAGRDLGIAQDATKVVPAAKRTAWLVNRVGEAEDLLAAHWPVIRMVARQLVLKPMSGGRLVELMQEMR